MVGVQIPYMPLLKVLEYVHMYEQVYGTLFKLILIFWFVQIKKILCSLWLGYLFSMLFCHCL